ncbi:MAG TPA: hydroxysqualene dehydroxylase HpnE [Candidatus Sulfotelmatobacter sp.]|nr:hydroxysqualene dehydroxylase HpnE [Candidatus Sulfotelmatobacter sp.]
MSSSPSQPTVAIAGGGLAGLAAACALSDAGFRVTLFEKRPFLGGRASSWEHPGTGEVVDNCQHVLFQVCTNLIEFYQRIGVANQIRWYDEMTFIEPGGRTSIMKSSSLPAPLHTAPSFLRFHFLSAADKLSIARALVPLTLTAQPDTGQSFQQWLDQHGQTRQAVERFWRPILISALSEELDLISISAAAQVVRESMKSPAARQMGVPTVPLTDLYNAAGDYIRARGGELHFRQPIESFTADASGVHLQLRNQEDKNSTPGAPPLSLRSLQGQGGDFDFLILALPFDALEKVLPQSPESAPIREQLSHFETAPITGIHLWFDRQISDLDHAVLLDRTIQWMFHKSRLQPMRTAADPARTAADPTRIPGDATRTAADPGRPPAADPARPPAAQAAERRENAAHGASRGYEYPSETAPEGRKNTGAPPPPGSYIELVVSSSKSLIDKSRAEIVDLALAEVREFFPAARAATLVKSTVIKELHATYSPRPSIDAHRPSAITGWPRVFLAGDWTATGWPATMEGAVRSGYLAAEAIARAAGLQAPRFLSLDLPPTGLMRLFK